MKHSFHAIKTSVRNYLYVLSMMEYFKESREYILSHSIERIQKVYVSEQEARDKLIKIQEEANQILAELQQQIQQTDLWKEFGYAQVALLMQFPPSCFTLNLKECYFVIHMDDIHYKQSLVLMYLILATSQIDFTVVFAKDKKIITPEGVYKFSPSVQAKELDWTNLHSLKVDLDFEREYPTVINVSTQIKLGEFRPNHIDRLTRRKFERTAMSKSSYGKPIFHKPK